MELVLKKANFQEFLIKDSPEAIEQKNMRPGWDYIYPKNYPKV